jgi:hypothetical protein
MAGRDMAAAGTGWAEPNPRAERNTGTWPASRRIGGPPALWQTEGDQPDVATAVNEAASRLLSELAVDLGRPGTATFFTPTLRRTSHQVSVLSSQMQ